MEKNEKVKELLRNLTRVLTEDATEEQLLQDFRRMNELIDKSKKSPFECFTNLLRKHEWVEEAIESVYYEQIAITNQQEADYILEKKRAISKSIERYREGFKSC